MNHIDENLKLLSIFHYVVAGIIGLFACIPIIHIVLGILMVLKPDMMCGENCTEPPPAFVGWLFIGIGAMVMLGGYTLAIMVAVAGRFLTRRKHYTFCMAVAAAMCLFMPFGTVLGVFTLITITKADVKALFAPDAAAA
jgi:hypothetical protein